MTHRGNYVHPRLLSILSHRALKVLFKTRCRRRRIQNHGDNVQSKVQDLDGRRAIQKYRGRSRKMSLDISSLETDAKTCASRSEDSLQSRHSVYKRIRSQRYLRKNIKVKDFVNEKKFNQVRRKDKQLKKLSGIDFQDRQQRFVLAIITFMTFMRMIVLLYIIKNTINYFNRNISKISFQDLRKIGYLILHAIIPNPRYPFQIQRDTMINI